MCCQLEAGFFAKVNVVLRACLGFPISSLSSAVMAKQGTKDICFHYMIIVRVKVKQSAGCMSCKTSVELQLLGRQSCWVLDLYYVDSEGGWLKGASFSVEYGSPYAYCVLDNVHWYDLTVEEAAGLARRAIYHATFQDGASGGVASVYYVDQMDGRNFIQ